MVRTALRLPVVVLSSVAALSLAGCGVANQSSKAVIPAGRQGVVHGGQQPVSGATIQMYAVGTTGDGSAATALLTPAVTTDANGGFTLTGTYTCPSPSALVYLVATGGNPGLSGSATNPNLAMMAALGPCGSLTSSTFIVMNELTTVAAVYSLAPFMASATNIGSATGDAAALSSAFTIASELVNTATGASPGTGLPAGATVPTMQINLLGDILATCVNSAGGAAGDSTYCGSLFSLTTPTTTPATSPATNTVTALLNLANNPGLNTQALFAMPSPAAPFQPMPSLTPPSFAVRPTFSSGFSVSPSSLSFGSLTTGFTSPAQTVTLTNNGTTPILVNNVGIIGTNASDYSSTLQASTCPYPLFPSQSCTTSVQFRPQGTGTRNAYLQVLTDDVNPEIDIPLAGQSIAPAAGTATLSPTSLTFTAFGVPQNVTLTNFGNGPLTINAINFGTNTGFSETDNCGTSLPAQSICTIAVTAAAKSSSSAVMTVVDDAAAGPQTIGVSYSGVIGAVSSMTSAPVAAFGAWAIGAQTLSAVYFTANGSNNLIGYGGTITGPNASDFAIENEGMSGPTYSSSGQFQCQTRGLLCDLIIRFIPSGLGVRTATLNLPGFLGPVGAVQLTGVGEPTGLDFALAIPSGGSGLPAAITINTSDPITGTITNTGTVPVTLNAPVIAGPNASQFSVAGACGTLAVGANCPFTLTASPTQVGPISATLTLIDSTGTVQRSLLLTTTGYASVPVISTKVLSFLPTQVGSVSAPLTATITAYNNGPVTITPEMGNSSAFQFSPSSCPQTPCQVSVTFAPTAANLFEGGVDVFDAVYGQASTIGFTGYGITGAPAVNLSPGSLTFALRSVGTTSIAQTVTLTNSGTGSVSLSPGLALIGANPGDFVLTNNCGSPLIAGASCTFTVSFSPMATGTRTASVEIVSNASSSPDFVQLSGMAQ